MFYRQVGRPLWEQIDCAEVERNYDAEHHDSLWIGVANAAY